MNIKRAKQEIKDAIEAYLLKDEYGAYCIPSVRQRPVLLMGPPGIGKKRIVEQIAKELRIGLVAYTITHHTRQSASGMPFIAEREYEGQNCSVTEYTMSEIISTIYDKMEQTGLREGILFLDEINGVSDSMSPTMLQFLKGRTFGNQRVPDGWIIVASGNLPEYNRSARELDVVTLDRLKRIDVAADFSVWKEYAYRQQIHPAILTYLETHRENFYRLEKTAEGKMFVTARGWEDLSQLIRVYEKLGKKVDREVVSQYLQHQDVAGEFTDYLELSGRYREEYKIDEILQGIWSPEVMEKIGAAEFDERISVIGLLVSALGEILARCRRMSGYVAKLYEYLIYYRDNQSVMLMDDLRMAAEEDLEELKSAELLTRNQAETMLRVIETLGRFSKELTGELFIGDEVFDMVREMFEKEKAVLDRDRDEAAARLGHVFHFIEEAFGESREMTAFIAELNQNCYSRWLIKEKGADLDYRYHVSLVFNEETQEIVRKIDEA